MYGTLLYPGLYLSMSFSSITIYPKKMKYTNKVHLKAFWLKICLKVGTGDGEVFIVIAALTGCTDSGRKEIDLQRI